LRYQSNRRDAAENVRSRSARTCQKYYGTLPATLYVPPPCHHPSAEQLSFFNRSGDEQMHSTPPPPNPHKI
jgi:hypothetical protein